MLTARGWWFLVVVVLVLVVGAIALPTYTAVPAILGLTLLAWFAFEWAVFQARANAAVSRLRLTRRVVQGGREVPMVWAGLAFEVRVAVAQDGPAGVPFAVLEDRVPQAADRLDGANEEVADLPPGGPAEIVYTLKCPAPGVLRFEGMRVRVADLHGFFYHRSFLRDGSEYLILPPLSDDEGRQRADKRFNTLPPPGVHRLRRPGTGSELLDLRDYRPGDPPKMIAWKPSARRDRLITKEFESDVPVRCVLFLDTSEGMRLGPPGHTPLTRMAAVASTVAQAAAGNRDLVGLVTFDDTAATATKPARTKPHLIRVMRALAEASALQPGTAGVPPEQLVRRAYPLAQELYPDLMSKRANSMPLGRLWVPLLDARFGWVAPAVILLSPLLILYRPWLGMMIEQAVRVTSQGWFWVLRLIVAAMVFVVLVLLPASLALLFWLVYGARGWFGARRLQLTRRKQLAALFALQDGTGPGGVERLIHDDAAFAARVGRFLEEHQVRCPVPLYDDHGRFRYRCAGKARVLADAIIRAVGVARDNELYVLLADLTELGEDLNPLLRAARVARTRHHQVLVIVPWPGDVPPPETDHGDHPAGPDSAGPPWEPTKRSRRKPPRPLDRQAKLLKVVKASLTRQYHEAFRHLRRAMGRVGATVVRVNEGDPVQLVLDRLDRLRGMRSRR
jgi:uncharacterized protein (DUF58 family)